MPKVILVPATGTAEDAAVFATALAAARLFGSHLVALHVRPDVRREIATMASVDMGVTAGLDTMIADLEAQSETREKAAMQAWTAFRTANNVTLADSPGTPGITGEWRAEVGNEADWLAEHGRTSDLVIAGRGREGGVVAMDVLETALMDSGKPLIVAPDNAPATLDGPVVVAWKNTRESAKAVAAALPFIRKASKVVILTVPESSDSEPDPSPVRLAAALRWHNSVEVKTLPSGGGEPVEILMKAAREAKATLLVMGGYGHTRLREAVFGGFTRAVLENAPIPVLMAH
jgi:nucleotide-binding universal stress UspA family protein